MESATATPMGTLANCHVHTASPAIIAARAQVTAGTVVRTTAEALGAAGGGGSCDSVDAARCAYFANTTPQCRHSVACSAQAAEHFGHFMTAQ